MPKIMLNMFFKSFKIQNLSPPKIQIHTKTQILIITMCINNNNAIAKY